MKISISKDRDLIRDIFQNSNGALMLMVRRYGISLEFFLHVKEIVFSHKGINKLSDIFEKIDANLLNNFGSDIINSTDLMTVAVNERIRQLIEPIMENMDPKPCDLQKFGLSMYNIVGKNTIPNFQAEEEPSQPNSTDDLIASLINKYETTRPNMSLSEFIHDNMLRNLDLMNNRETLWRSCDDDDYMASLTDSLRALGKDYS